MATEKKLKDPAEAALSAIEQALSLDVLTRDGETRPEPRLPDVGDAEPLLDSGLDAVLSGRAEVNGEVLGHILNKSVLVDLDDEDIAAIHVSRLLRTHETAAPLAASRGLSPRLTEGIEEIRAGIWKTMDAFPGNHMTEFPSLWHVVDEPTGRVICEVDNPMRDPGDGSVITATNITILTYAGDGLWSREEDIYNPLEFGIAAMQWCDKARELGTLDDDAATWASTFGRAFWG